MAVDQATALRAERDGKTVYFCGEHRRAKFLSTPAAAKPADKSGGCCGGVHEHLTWMHVVPTVGHPLQWKKG